MLNHLPSPADRVKALIDAVEAVRDYEDRFFQSVASHDPPARRSSEQLHQELTARHEQRDDLRRKLLACCTDILTIAGLAGITVRELVDLGQRVDEACSRLRAWERECAAGRRTNDGTTLARRFVSDPDLYCILGDALDGTRALHPEILDRLLTISARHRVPQRSVALTASIGISARGPAPCLVLLAAAGEPLPCRLSTKELVELLKMPKCVRELRRVVLDQLGNRYGRRFDKNQDFVRYAREQSLDVDFATPTKCPDRKLPPLFRRVGELAVSAHHREREPARASGARIRSLLADPVSVPEDMLLPARCSPVLPEPAGGQATSRANQDVFYRTLTSLQYSRPVGTCPFHGLAAVSNRPRSALRASSYLAVLANSLTFRISSVNTSVTPSLRRTV